MQAAAFSHGLRLCERASCKHGWHSEYLPPSHFEATECAVRWRRDAGGKAERVHEEIVKKCTENTADGTDMKQRESWWRMYAVVSLSAKGAGRTRASEILLEVAFEMAKVDAASEALSNSQATS
jgi:hypothetical protein